MTSVDVPEKVADIMTRKLITLGEEDRIHDVEQVMTKYRFRHLPVVRGEKLVGIITQRDMLRISSSTFSTQKAVRDHLIHYMPAGKVMCSEVATVSPETSLVTAGQLMWDMKIGCLCVTDDDDNLVGIVTEADFMRLAIRLVRDLRTTEPPPRRDR